MLLRRTMRRSRPAMFPRWAFHKTRHPDVRAVRPFLKRYGIRSHMAWVKALQKQMVARQ